MGVVTLLAATAVALTGGSMQLSSTAFAHLGAIPSVHTCEGADRAPALSWSGAPAGTRSLALVVHDPDAPDPKAPKRDWVHWLVYDLPLSTAQLPEGGALPTGARQGLTDFRRVGWGGPCPPIGRHRYFFELYALDAVLGDLGQPDRAKLETAMRGHVLAKAELIGTYQKQVK